MMKKISIGTVLAVLLLLGGGVIYQGWAERADLQRYPAPGRFVAVDGLQLHVDCRGSGEPVLVLEAGLTAGSTSWDLVHDGLAAVTRTCAYDRPGLDWSDPLDHGAPASAVAQRLHALLEAAGIAEQPLILVGMSAGGVYVREYFAAFPQRVVGMVLVDSSHEQQNSRLPKPDNAPDMQGALRACAWLQPLGVIRAASALDMIIGQYPLPHDLTERMRASLYRSHTCRVIANEMVSFEADLAPALPPRSLGDLPLLVLSQGKPPEANDAAGITPELAQRMREVWNTLQTELAALSSRGRRVVAEQSGHVIQFDQPDLVIREIRTFVDAVRQAGPI